MVNKKKEGKESLRFNVSVTQLCYDKIQEMMARAGMFRGLSDFAMTAFRDFLFSSVSNYRMIFDNVEKDAKRHRVPKEEILDTFYQEMYDAIVALGQVADEFFGTGFVRQIHVSIPYDLQNAIQNFGWSQNNLQILFRVSFYFYIKKMQTNCEEWDDLRKKLLEYIPRETESVINARKNYASLWLDKESTDWD